MSPTQQYHGQFCMDGGLSHKVSGETVFRFCCRDCTAHCAFVVTHPHTVEPLGMLACKISFVEQSPFSEADSCWASQKFPRILWNRPVRYRIHNIPPLCPVVSQINPDQDFPFYLWKIHFNSISACSLDLFSFTISSPKSYEHLPFLQYVPHVPPLILDFYHPNNMYRAVQLVKLPNTQFSPPPHPVAFFLLGHNTPAPPSLCSCRPWRVSGVHSATAVTRRGNEVGCRFVSKGFESADVTCS
jgi:hypothetical protein